MCARLIRGVGDFELTRLKMGTNKNNEKSEGWGGGRGEGYLWDRRLKDERDYGVKRGN